MFHRPEGPDRQEEGDPLAEIRAEIRQRLGRIWGLMRSGLCTETERDVLEWIQDRCERAAKKTQVTTTPKPFQLWAALCHR